MEKQIGHLDDKNIIEAVIDEKGMDGDSRRHLLECSVCRARKEALGGALENFGRISRAQAPAQFRKPRISAQAGRAFRPAWKLAPIFGLAAASAILALLLSPLTFRNDRLYTQEAVYREMVQDETFMAEVEKLEEDPLQRFHADMGVPGEDEGNAQSPAIQDQGLWLDGGPRDA